MIFWLPPFVPKKTKKITTAKEEKTNLIPERKLYENSKEGVLEFLKDNFKDSGFNLEYLDEIFLK